MILLRHRLAAWFLLVACRIHRYFYARWFMRAAIVVGRFIHGPLDPERLYSKKPVRVISLPRARAVPVVRPDVSVLPDCHPEDSDLEKWLAQEAQCER